MGMEVILLLEQLFSLNIAFCDGQCRSFRMQKRVLVVISLPCASCPINGDYIRFENCGWVVRTQRSCLRNSKKRARTAAPKSPGRESLRKVGAAVQRTTGGARTAISSSQLPHSCLHLSQLLHSAANMLSGHREEGQLNSERGSMVITDLMAKIFNPSISDTYFFCGHDKSLDFSGLISP